MEDYRQLGAGVRLVLLVAPIRRRPGREGGVVTVLVQVPLEDGESGGVVLVEMDRDDIPGGLALAAPEPGHAAARAAQSLSASLEQLEPVLREVKDKLATAAPDHFAVEFGIKLGGETGIILAKGTAEVNLKITMMWDREPGVGGGADGRIRNGDRAAAQLEAGATDSGPGPPDQ
jgi:hypothetical protein